MHTLDAQSVLQVYGEASGWPMHMGSLQVLDPSTSPEPFGVDRVRRLYRERLPHLPIYRQRLQHAPGLLGRPVWVEDPDIDVDDHIQAVTVEPPGSDEQLGALAGEIMERPMDHERPLWDCWVIDGLAGGRVALLARNHHALVDGVRGAAVQAVIFDSDPDSPLARPGSVPGPGPDAPSSLAMLGSSASHLAAAPIRLARTAGLLASTATRTAVSTARGKGAGLSMPPSAPRTPFNAAVTSRRDAAFCSVPLQPVKDLAHREGATVNDVVLVVVGGALRRYLSEHDALPSRSLVTGVPVGMASKDGQTAGNRWQVMTVTLATDRPDAVDRLHAISRATKSGKAAQRAADPDVWADLLEVPPLVISAGARSYARLGLVRLLPPSTNVVVSNVRGAPDALYLAGARLVANYPLGPIADGLGLNVTVIGYAQSLDFGLHVCPDLVPDPWLLVSALRAEADELAHRGTS